MGDLQELADEAFADLLVKHGVPKNLRDALRKSAAAGKRPPKRVPKQRQPESTRARQARKKHVSISR
jgi:hypothetical protein